MIKFEIYVGLNDKTTKRQEITTIDAYKICVNICKDCSISEIMGFYTHKNGEIVTEKSLKIELFEKTDEDIKTIAEKLKIALNQESVIINRIVVKSEFI